MNLDALQQASETTPGGALAQRGVRFRAADGLRLSGRVYGDGSAGPVVVIASAMGVRQRFYRAFATHLAARGVRVLTFDYRGIGDSRVPDGAGYRVDIASWGELDLDAALRFAADELGASRLGVVTHSVGGQLLPLARSAPDVAAAYLVASQSGHWRHWDGLARWRMAATWHLVMPTVTAALGRFPGKLLGGGDDLPAGVAQQWARWGRDPGYVLSHGPHVEARFAAVTCPVVAVDLADDPLAPARAVDALAAMYPASATSRRTFARDDVAGRSIGHFGFFRPSPGEALWPDAVSFLERHLL